MTFIGNNNLINMKTWLSILIVLCMFLALYFLGNGKQTIHFIASIGFTVLSILMLIIINTVKNEKRS